jgi:cytochrome c oxidase assembly factor CtaG
MRAIAAVLLIAGITVTVLSVVFPKQEPRHHIYYCVHPYIYVALPCMYRRNDPVPV